MIFYFHAPLFQQHTHFTSEIISHILRCCCMVSTLVWNLVAVILSIVYTAVPLRLSGVNIVAASLRRYAVTHVVQQIKFKFRPDDHPVCNLFFLHVFHCLEGHISWILVKRKILVIPNSTDISAHSQSRNFCKRIHSSCFRIRNKYHIAFFYGSIAVIRAVKTNSVNKNVIIKSFHRDGHMTPTAI